MRGRDCGHIVDFAVRGEAAVEIVTVPRGESLAVIAAVLFRRVHAPTDLIGLADTIDAAALRDRPAGLNDARTGGHAIARIDAAGGFGGWRTVWDEQGRGDPRGRLGRARRGA